MSGRKRITLVAGARPNFMKIAPIVHAIIKDGSMDYRLVHTGQHYDKVMSDTFFEELNIPKPDVNLGCGGGSQAEQTAKIMEAFEQDLMENKTDLVVVVGDVTSTMACTIAAKKIHVDVAHVEAGIRSYDMTMPEEVNRMVTDSLADYFFTTTEDAKLLLENRNVNPSVVYFVGNVMIDTLMANYDRLRKPDFYDRMNLKQGEYLVLTMHRPNNVDNIAHFDLMLREICENANGLPIVFPIHPRTAKMMTANGLSFSNLHLVEPLGYLEFNYLVRNSKAVVTDSGGVTEETTVMGIPCMTLRDNTERPETCSVGTNELIGTDPQNIAPAMKRLMSGEWKKGGIPEKWDGHAAERIVDIIKNLVE
ncbi:MAG: UDP-N-acetylglucosamine 2-epimerase (non-hydrolyzing) [Paludibacteraceae bacterium]|nr:UDP-N-acetylglucosamine 2-epimerase (non-hydrolyzing) [Paludibacteraceae bacterium]